MIDGQVQLDLQVANRCWDEAFSEYRIAEAVDRESEMSCNKEAIEKMSPIGRRECLLGALWGIFVGDSLGLATDGSINLRACRRDYMFIEDVVGPFPGTQADGGMHLASHSHLEYIGAEPTIYHEYCIRQKNRKSDIMGGKEVFHGLPGVHMHMCLGKGASTLTCKLAKLIIDNIIEKDGFERDSFLDAYLEFMLSSPDNDTFIDPYHVEFFERYAGGNKLYYSAGIGKAAAEATSTALVQIVPLVVSLLPEVGQ